MRMSSEGIEVEVPQGWDGEIFQRLAMARRRGEPEGEETQPVLHLGNFALPVARGDFGSGAVELMQSEHVLIVLFEYDPAAASTPLFSASGIPEVDPEHFSPEMMQRPIEGQSGAQYFFNTGGRAFCLYVVMGAHARRNQLIPEIRQVMQTLQVADR